MRRRAHRSLRAKEATYWIKSGECEQQRRRTWYRFQEHTRYLRGDLSKESADALGGVKVSREEEQHLEVGEESWQAVGQRHQRARVEWRQKGLKRREVPAMEGGRSAASMADERQLRDADERTFECTDERLCTQICALRSNVRGDMRPFETTT
eukprot:3095356-Pleurochrysis_carterae.AAC.4